MRSRLTLLPVAFLLACGGSSDSTTNPVPNPGAGGGGNPTPVVTTSVDMKSNSFTPAAIKVSPSATVNFTNSDGITHNVTFSAPAITNSGNFDTGTKSIAMPAAAGTYAYRCTLHAGMSGTVQVQ